MPKMTVNATELVKTNVDFVALVKRGANRIPFRITKADNEETMDLYQIGRQLYKSEERAPASSVIGVIVRKGADAETVLSVLKEAGIDTANMLAKADDASVTAVRKGEEQAVASVLKLDNDVALIVSGDVKKAFSSWECQSANFAEMLKAQGFFPSVYLAKDVLTDTIYSVMGDAKTPQDAVQGIQKAGNDFVSYIATLASAIPVQCFKAEELLKAAKAKAKTPSDNDGDEGRNSSDGVNDAAAMKKAEEEKAAALAKATNGTGDGAEAGKGTGTNAKATDDDKKNIEANQKVKKTEGTLEEVLKGNTINIRVVAPSGETPAGEGGAQPPSDSRRAQVAGNSDKDASMEDKNRGQQPSVSGNTVDVTKAGSEGGANTDIGAGNKKIEAGTTESGAGSADITKMFADLAKSFTDGMASLREDVQKSVAAVAKDVEGIKGEVAKTSELARKTDEALNGTVLGDTGGDRTVRTQKSEGGGEIPLIDTAVSRRVA